MRVHQILVLLAVIVRGGLVRAIFARALGGKAGGDDAARFTAHMLMEFARMSVDDGLVMQMHVGSFRDHDAGADIPVATEWTRNLRPLLS